VKSAYELALERLEAQGIERPSAEALDDATKRAIAEVRREVEAKLAELGILHRDRLRKLVDPAAREAEEDDFRRERERIESRGEREVARLRDASRKESSA